MLRDGGTGKTKSHVPSLSAEEFKRYQGQWYLTLGESGKKRALSTSTRFFELQSLSKTVFTVSLANRLQNQFHQHNIGDGTLPQAIPGGTRLTGVGGAHNIFM